VLLRDKPVADAVLSMKRRIEFEVIALSRRNGGR
jgi:hypothetical protein